jgi:hypothetical protein
VTVSDFNKSTLVSIREYYVTDSGETKPGKKVCADDLRCFDPVFPSTCLDDDRFTDGHCTQGISLTIDQYNALLASAPLIESALAKKDIQVVRPDYEGDLGAKIGEHEKEEEENEERDDEKTAKKEEDEDDDDDDEE